METDSSDSALDDALLERARRGDRQAHATLYGAFAPMVFTLAYRMLGSKATAEDVLQDSFVEVIRSAAQFRGDAPIRAWIKRIAVNKCLSHLRSPWVARRAFGSTSRDGKEHVEALHDEKAARPDADAPDMQHCLGQQQELEQLLNLLSPTARVVVWMHEVEGYTHKEIGRLMGRSTSFSKTQLSRAFEQLRENFEPEETDQEAAPCLGVLKPI